VDSDQQSVVLSQQDVGRLALSESIKRTKKIKTIKPIHNMVLIRHKEGAG
jgi:hypothetical protein